MLLVSVVLSEAPRSLLMTVRFGRSAGASAYIAQLLLLAVRFGVVKHPRTFHYKSDKSCALQGPLDAVPR